MNDEPIFSMLTGKLVDPYQTGIVTWTCDEYDPPAVGGYWGIHLRSPISPYCAFPDLIFSPPNLSYNTCSNLGETIQGSMTCCGMWYDPRLDANNPTPQGSGGMTAGEAPCGQP